MHANEEITCLAAVYSEGTAVAELPGGFYGFPVEKPLSDLAYRLLGRFIARAPASVPCPVCGQISFWIGADGSRTCGLCAPPPVEVLDVLRTMDLAELVGEEAQP